MTKREIIRKMNIKNYIFCGEVLGEEINKMGKYTDCKPCDKYLKFKKENEIIYINSEEYALGRRVIRVLPNGRARSYAINNF